jgi:MerR family mercuric resistance operon transcriptional regulator
MYTCGEVKALTMEHAKSVREKIDDLTRMETTLLDIASRCSGSAAPDCPILDALSDISMRPNQG